MNIEKYLEDHCSQEPEYLKNLRRNTYLKVLYPQMLSGHVQGRFLAMISRILRPANILEIGTFTGYSALCLCEGLKVGGKLFTIEKNDELEEIARQNFAQSPYNQQIEFLIGNAINVLPKMNQKFDLVFIDGHKPEYCEYLKLVKPKLNYGALVLADNVLWYNKVIDIKESDESTVSLRNFNDMVQNDTDFENVIIPLRDGIFLFQYLPR